VSGDGFFGGNVKHGWYLSPKMTIFFGGKGGPQIGDSKSIEKPSQVSCDTRVHSVSSRLSGQPVRLRVPWIWSIILIQIITVSMGCVPDAKTARGSWSAGGGGAAARGHDRGQGERAEDAQGVALIPLTPLILPIH
jgi:hypothetical protein